MKVEENLFSPINEGEILGQERFFFLISFEDITNSISYGKGKGLEPSLCSCLFPGGGGSDLWMVTCGSVSMFTLLRPPWWTLHCTAPRSSRNTMSVLCSFILITNFEVFVLCHCV